jgi:hypothetical protein
VPLERLLSVAVLTPAQASFVAVQLLYAADLSEVDGEHPSTARVGAVTMTPTGDVTVAQPSAADGTCVTELLERLLDNAHHLPAHPRQEQLVLLHLLEEAARDPQLQPDARARELEGALADTLGSRTRQRLPGELAALVDAFTRMTSAAPEPTDRPSSPKRVKAGAAASAGPVARRATSRPPRRGSDLLHPRKRGRRVALLAVVVPAVLAASGYLAVGGSVAGIVGSHGAHGNPTAPGGAAPSDPAAKVARRARPQHANGLLAVAPLRHGPITSVAVQESGPCAPGALCRVTVTVHFRPSSTARPVVWKVGTARGCTRAITWAAPTSVTALAGWSTVYATSSVRIPLGRSLSLIALTTAPDRARSRPVPISGSLHC